MTKGRTTTTVDLTMEHSRNISVDQPTTYSGPWLSIVHHPGYNTTQKKYLQHVVVLRLNVSKALILWFLSWVNNKTVIIFSYKGYCAMSFIFYVNVVCLFCIIYCIWLWNKVLSFNKNNNKWLDYFSFSQRNILSDAKLFGWHIRFKCPFQQYLSDIMTVNFIVRGCSINWRKLSTSYN